MRIALIMPEYPSQAGHGGIATYTYVLAAALAERGHSVTLLVKPGTVTDTLPGTVRIRTLQPVYPKGLSNRLKRKILPELIHEKALAESARSICDSLFSSEGLDGVEIPEYNGNAIAFAGASYPVVIRLHTPTYLVDQLNGVKPGWRKKRWYKLESDALLNAKAIAAPSLALKREICAHEAIPDSRISVIPYPIDVKSFSPPVNDRIHSPLRLLYTGRLEKRKGMDTLVELVRLFFGKRRDLKLTLAGAEAGDEGRLYRKRLIEAAGRERLSLEFLGARPRHELPALYRNSDIFIIPSLFDNSPNALFEAMACGLPCLGSDVGGINEIIDPEKTGLLFRSKDATDGLRQLERLMADPLLRRTLGEAAREKVLTIYHPQTVADQMAAFYAGLTR